MSRPLRIEYPGAWYHVMNRGLNHRCIFHQDNQRQSFLELLADIHQRFGVQIHAYCLMDNHYHLLLHTPNAHLGRAMRHLDGVYTQRFNRYEKRDGPLFRGRYKAILIDVDNYILSLSRYIHLNPVSAKMCIVPEAYKWSSYPAYLMRARQPAWLYCNEVLSRCAEKQAIERYYQFVAEGIDENLATVFSKNSWPSLLGNQEWVEKIKKYNLADSVVDDEIPERNALMQPDLIAEIHALMQKVAEYYGISVAELKHDSAPRAENVARAHLIYLAATYGNHAHKKIAEAIGNISRSGTSQVIYRMRKKLVSNHNLQWELETLKKHIGLC